MCKKLPSAMLAVAVALVFLVGCSKSSGAGSKAHVTLRFATQNLVDPMGIVTKGILASFDKKNPNVTLSIEEAAGNNLITLVNTEIMAGDTPDVFTYWRPESGWNVPSYVKAGDLANLTALSQTPALKNIFPAYAMKTAKEVDNTVYAIPRTNYFIEFLVNKDIFNKYNIPLPTSWQNLVNAIPQLKAHGIIPWAESSIFNQDDSARPLNAILDRVFGNKGALALMDGKAHWTNNPKVLTALKYFITIAANDGPPDESVLSIGQSVAKYLNTGKAAMVLDNVGTVDLQLTKAIEPSLEALPFPLTPVTVEKTPSAEADVTNLVYASAKSYKDPAKRAHIDELITDLCDQAAATSYAEDAQQVVPQLGLNLNTSLIPKIMLDAEAVQAKEPGDKWLLSFMSNEAKGKWRDIVDNVWYGKLTDPTVMASELDAGLYGKSPQS
ncbi:MAG TPA: ABC transporter substrate-binding protein [Spirochaetia bacterium]|nr:ABC transporter substrate-binding protein [Spirochaetia bacterium]